jgi:uncharacterized protein
MKKLEWVVKASKFCNLRCAYCYEWNSLSDRSRISIDGWERILRAIRSYHLMLEQQLGVDVQSCLIWHGGEPLALPITYLDRAMVLQHEMLQDLDHRILVQSNLYRLTDEMLYLLKRHDVGLGVSMDVIGGVRRDVRRNETEDAVVANLDLLERRGVGYGAITVLAKHNHRQLKAVHDFWANRRIDFRILPLFEGPDSRPEGLFEVSDDDLAVAMCDLFDHWIENGAVIDVLPLSEWLQNVLRKILKQRRPVYDRRSRGESVLLVETSGDLYQTDERGDPALRLGNVMTQTIEQILASESYNESLNRTDEKTERFCQRCSHYGFCNGYPVHAEPFTVAPSVGCPITTAVHDHIERYLLETGYDALALAGLLQPEPREWPV